MDNLPIDIHSNKLLEWLISRRHCPKSFQTNCDDIRQKISNAIKDLPENEQILKILNGSQFINYFHCKEILKILYETEKDTKNILGFYSSQRIKDWKEIISLYEQENVYLGEAANFLQRYIQYEVPSLRRQITKTENGIKEAERKENDYSKLAIENNRLFHQELTKWGLNNEIYEQKKKLDNLRNDLMLIAESQPKAELLRINEIKKALDYFFQFSKQIGQETDDMFPLLRLITVNLKRLVSDISVYEWKYGKKPDVLLPPALVQIQKVEINEENDEIDFGDEDEIAEIDFCTNGDFKEEIEIISFDGIDNINDEETILTASGEEALPILEHPSTCGIFLDELSILIAFLHFRIKDECATDGIAQIYLSGIEQEEIKQIQIIPLSELKCWLLALQNTFNELNDPQRLQLLRLRTSKKSFVNEIYSKIEQKMRLELKYRQLQQLSKEKQKQCLETIQTLNIHLQEIIEAAKILQENLEEDISRKYNGREVYIMGEINAVLYGT
ncbi:hypothetical protein Mgra_00000637 [Meloidogyne graminicola]|uniref:CDK5RAP3-like protein n=1 Tax=Meloidogyne graminicola TaxID=189291 RepID=A0A8T0A328_9BILA|nr:hypothetical protein Mgra_00000637 [Meloidogyne graminicola]